MVEEPEPVGPKVNLFRLIPWSRSLLTGETLSLEQRNLYRLRFGRRFAISLRDPLPAD